MKTLLTLFAVTFLTIGAGYPQLQQLQVYPNGCNPDRAVGNHELGRERVYFTVDWVKPAANNTETVAVTIPLDDCFDPYTIRIESNNIPISALVIMGSNPKGGTTVVYDEIDSYARMGGPKGGTTVVYDDIDSRLINSGNPKGGTTVVYDEIDGQARVEETVIISVLPYKNCASGTFTQHTAYVDLGEPQLESSNTADITIVDEPEISIEFIEMPDYEFITLDPNDYRFSLEAVVTGGTPPYSIMWDGGFAGNTISGTLVEPYIIVVEVTDAAQCRFASEYLIFPKIACECESGKVKMCEEKSNGDYRSRCVKLDDVQKKMDEKGWAQGECPGIPEEVIMCHTKSGGESHSHCVKTKDIQKKLEKEGGEWSLGYCAPQSQKRVNPVVAEIGHSVMNAYPNPFSGSLTIEFSLLHDANVALFITDIMGKHVYQQDVRPYASGTYTIDWDGTSASGQVAENGIYFVTLMTGDTRKTFKVIRQE